MDTLKVKMLTDAPGSRDGIRVEHFDAGETYEVGTDLAETFIAHGLAEAAAKPAAAKPAPAKTKRAAALENK